jgi:hypothetical protein
VKRSTLLSLAVALLLAVVIVFLFPRRTAVPSSKSVATPSRETPAATTQSTAAPAATIERPPPPDPIGAAPLTEAEKAARIEKIKSDYAEIHAKAVQDYGEAGANFPGGMSAFIRQLALLVREERADFAAVLTPQELEELELHETAAGKLVERLLGTTSATDEQRRAVFRAQREFDDRFALSFEKTPEALLEREAARQQTQEKIRAVLGDDLFAAWLAGEGADYAGFVAFIAQQNLPPSAALELWQAKNEFSLQRLELAAARDLSADQRAAAQKALLQKSELRVTGIIGPAGLQAARGDALHWLPRK